MLRALTPSSKDAKSPLKGSIGFDDLVDKDAFERLHGLIPAQPAGESRVWGVTSFAATPVQQRGYCMPASSRQGSGTHSRMWLAVVDPDATATAPGVASYEKEDAAGRVSSEAGKDTDVLGKVFAKRLGDCRSCPSNTQVLVENAKGRADRYVLEAGFAVGRPALVRRTRGRLGLFEMFPSPRRRQNGVGSKRSAR